VKFSRRWLDATALHDGNQIHVALTNMGGQRLSVSLVGVADSSKIKSIAQKRLYYRDGEVRFEPNNVLKDLSAVEVDVEETTIVTIELEQSLEIDDALQRNFYYAAETAVQPKDVSKEGFQISIPDATKIEAARLVIGVHRDGGLKQALKLNFNGKEASTNQKWAAEVKNLFEPATVNIPASMIRKENFVKIGNQQGLTITSVHLEIDSAGTP